MEKISDKISVYRRHLFRPPLHASPPAAVAWGIAGQSSCGAAAASDLLGLGLGRGAEMCGLQRSGGLRSSGSKVDLILAQIGLVGLQPYAATS
jgi:hypothetical protein